MGPPKLATIRRLRYAVFGSEFLGVRRNQAMLRYLILSASIFSFSGCGPSGPAPVKVDGSVTLGGKPVEGATVTFVSKSGGRSASGKTDADGSFVLTTNSTGDGAVPGEYVVTIAKADTQSLDDITAGEGGYGADYEKMMGAAASGSMEKVIKNELPSKYADASQSDLLRTVVAGETNSFSFDL